MFGEIRISADRLLRETHRQHTMRKLEKRLDIVEREIMKYARIDSWTAAKFAASLIGEREVVIAKLKKQRELNGKEDALL